ncbi:hypothetical protein AKO1_015467 [Acrasis kona]|uniref:Uncharacterized protein n=1 Tax=Acrasis kona TaxID=1008807 RepID=A0AAW2ZG05_9EUKA
MLDACTFKTIKGVPQKIKIVKTVHRYRKPLNLRNIPRIPPPYHTYCLAMNIIFPGLGTLVASRLVESQRKRKLNLIYGILQMLLGIILIGWIWSVIWGIMIFYRNNGAAHKLKDGAMDALLK